MYKDSHPASVPFVGLGFGTGEIFIVLGISPRGGKIPAALFAIPRPEAVQLVKDIQSSLDIDGPVQGPVNPLLN